MTPETFWTYVDRSNGEGVCWLWIGATNGTGYGSVRFHDRTHKAHRVAWELANGRAPASDLHICHRCANRLCCNPAHLYEGTATRNNRDIVEHGHAWWQTATHCRNGHEWTPENTIYGHFTGRPWTRRCRQCNEAMRARQRELRRLKRVTT